MLYRCDRQRYFDIPNYWLEVVANSLALRVTTVPIQLASQFLILPMSSQWKIAERVAALTLSVAPEHIVTPRLRFLSLF